MSAEGATAQAVPEAQTYPVTLQRRHPQAPLVGVAAAVFNDAGHVLLVKRGRPPGVGQWGLPGGLLDLGERLADGARREVQEECGIDVDIRDVVGAFDPIVRDEHDRIEYHYVVIDFWARLLTGEAVAQDDANDVAWVAVADLAHFEVSSESQQIILRAYCAWQMEHATHTSGRAVAP